MDWGNCVYKTTATIAGQTGQTNAATIDCIPALMGLLIKAAYMFIGITAVFFIFFAGFKYITSGGEAKQAQAAQQTLTYAIIGLIVVILSFVVIQLVATITGVSCILQIGFTQCNQPIPSP